MPQVRLPLELRDGQREARRFMPKAETISGGKERMECTNAEKVALTSCVVTQQK